jgi:hypothetical protein
MPCTLLFNDDGWEVATDAWTAAAAGDRKTRVCYAWAADGVSLLSGATGISSVTLPISFSDFLQQLKRHQGGIWDMRQ